MNERPSIAIVVPVLQDSDALGGLLGQIDRWTEKPQQLIVVSAEPGAGLAALCAQHACRLLCCEPNRGLQLDIGARAAEADLLWFVHADAELPADGIAAIRAALRRGAESGCFRFQFQGRDHWTASLLSALINWRVFCGGTPYGDQGLFALKQVYLRADGFASQPLFEEVRLVKRLRERGSFERLSTPIRVATRRWERDGWWARSLRNRWLAVRYMLGTPAERLAHGYYHSDNGRHGARR